MLQSKPRMKKLSDFGRRRCSAQSMVEQKVQAPKTCYRLASLVINLQKALCLIQFQTVNKFM